MTALRQFGISTQRVQEIAALVDQKARVRRNSADNPALNEQALPQLDNSIAKINDQVGSVPFVRLQLALAPFVQTCRRWVRADRRSLREETVLVATNALALAARLAFETRDDP